MTREQFLQDLRIALQGKIPQAQVNGQLRYYESYIIEESRKGRTEEQVIEELGNPRLIAKTIIGVANGNMEQNLGAETWREKTDWTGADESRGFHINFDEENGWDVRYGRFRFCSWYGRLLLGIVFVILLVLLVQIGILLLPILMGLFMVGAILYVAYLLFFGNRR